MSIVEVQLVVLIVLVASLSYGMLWCSRTLRQEYAKNAKLRQENKALMAENIGLYKDNMKLREENLELRVSRMEEKIDKLTLTMQNLLLALDLQALRTILWHVYERFYVHREPLEHKVPIIVDEDGAIL